ncbi:MAG: VOC family protein, partial [Burkholderiales bacterium]
MTRLPGKFVWFEHLSPELDRARAFYKSWLGWSSEPAPIGGQSYHLIVNHGQGIGGFRTAPADSPTHWHAFLSVADVDAAAERAQELGATLLMPPTD